MTGIAWDAGRIPIGERGRGRARGCDRVVADFTKLHQTTPQTHCGHVPCAMSVPAVMGAPVRVTAGRARRAPFGPEPQPRPPLAVVCPTDAMRPSRRAILVRP